MSDPDRVARRFDRAAPTYGAATPIQRRIAAALADQIAASPMAPGGRVAEWGCGTGYLPEMLIPRLAPALWVATDIAPAMIAAAAARLSAPALAWAVMDAARPALGGGFDLVCSSLTLQWLSEPERVLADWRARVRPGGRLAVATLVEGSLKEWRAALVAAGAPEPGPPFATLEQARGWFAAGAQITPLTLVDRHPSALHFARAARAAGIDAGFHRALSASTMRRALAALDASGAAVTYEAVLAVERV